MFHKVLELRLTQMPNRIIQKNKIKLFSHTGHKDAQQQQKAEANTVGWWPFPCHYSKI